MKKIINVLLVSFLLVSTSIQAKEKIIEDGFKAFKEGGAALAWPAFSKGSPLEGSKELIAQASQFGRIEAYYGKYVSHEYIHIKELGDNNKVIYVVLNLENGPMFGKFQLYKKGSNWIAPNFIFHTHIDQVWPSAIYTN